LFKLIILIIMGIALKNVFIFFLQSSPGIIVVLALLFPWELLANNIVLNNVCQQRLESTITTEHLVDGKKVKNEFSDTDRGLSELFSPPSRLYSWDSFDWDYLRQHKLKVLDAGAAEGRTVYELGQLSIDSEGLDVRYLAEGASRPPPKVFPADMTKIPRPNGHYHLILSTQSLLSYTRNLSLAAEVLREFDRVLAAGGKIMLSPVRLEMLQFLFHHPVFRVEYIRPAADLWLQMMVPQRLSFSHEILTFEGQVILGRQGDPYFRPRLLPGNFDPIRAQMALIGQLNGGVLPTNPIVFGRWGIQDTAAKAHWFRMVQGQELTLHHHYLRFGNVVADSGTVTQVSNPGSIQGTITFCYAASGHCTNIRLNDVEGFAFKNGLRVE
jgi:hypothetical protein